jgi:protocatechuate 3,4-dioxygenase, beta subunit
VRAFAVAVSVSVLGLGAAGFPASASTAATCRPTPDDGSGPFGRGAPPRRAKIGTGHVLTGRVFSSVGCSPLAGARIHLWQANRRGEYVRAGSATVVTDRAGRFRFEGPRPVSYEGRPPHIHLRIVADEHELLFTRYVPRTSTTARGFIRLVLRPQRL